MRVTSQRGLSYLQSSLLAWRRRIRHRVATRIEVSDGTVSAMFNCHSAIEERRAVSLFHKEPGTVAWLRNNIRPGQVFVDIGANVGIYSVLAGQLVGSSGRTFSFEPHAVNFGSLMENIALNGLQDVCVPIATALADKPCHLPFYYASLTAGSSMSQLGQTVDPDGRAVDRGVKELKAATSLDQLIEDGLVDSPDHIKIDVDGIEDSIVRGMQKTLTGQNPPTTIQVEIQHDTRVPVIKLMSECGYDIDHTHHTEAGQLAISRGSDPDEITHNIVFTRKAA